VTVFNIRLQEIYCYQTNMQIANYYHSHLNFHDILQVHVCASKVIQLVSISLVDKKLKLVS